MAAKMEPKFSPPSKGGISGLKVVFFFLLLPLGAIFGGVVDFFLCKRGGEARKEGFSANEKRLGKRFGVVFSFNVVVTGLELTTGKPKAHSIIRENPVTAQNKKNKGNPPHG